MNSEILLSGISMRRSGSSNSVDSANVSTIPVKYVPISAVPLDETGSIVQSGITDALYVSTGTRWKEYGDLSSVTLVSVGGGVSIVVDGLMPLFTVASFSAGGGVTITSTPTDVTFSITGLKSLTSGSSPGASLFTSDSTAQNAKLRTIVGDSVIVITSPSVDQVQIGMNTSSPALVNSIKTALPLLGTSVKFLADETNPSITVKSVLAGTNCAFVDNGSYIVLNAIAVPPPPQTFLSSVGAGLSIVSDGTGPDLSMYGIKAGVGIVVTPLAGDISISYTAVAGVSSLAAISPLSVDVPTGNITVTSNTTGNIGDGFYAYLNASFFQTAYQPFITTAGFWTMQWDQGGLFSNGLITIQKDGIYAFSWGTCVQNTTTTTELFLNGVPYSGQNAFDTDGQGIASGYVTLGCKVGDVAYLTISGNNDIYPDTRADSGYNGATYISCIKVSEYANPIPARPVIPSTAIGVNAYLSSDIPNNNQAFQPVISASSWTLRYNTNITWADGIITIIYPGVYVLSWGTCAQDTDCTTMLFKNGVCIQGQNAFDTDGQGIGSGCAMVPCLAGDIFYLVVTRNNAIYADTRGDSGFGGASYFGAIRIPGS